MLVRIDSSFRQVPMKARDLDTLLSVLGAVTTVSLIIFKGALQLQLEDCLVAGASVAACTKFIAIARIAEIIKGSNPHYSTSTNVPEYPVVQAEEHIV